MIYLEISMIGQLRFYSFVNFYLSSIQQGIQSGHALGEIVYKYDQAITRHRSIVMEFLRDHKTWIVLNGGLSENVSSLLLFLQDNEHRLQRAIPYAPFYEDQKSLSGIMTCVGLILPEEYFSAVPAGTIPTVPLGDYASGDIERDDYVFIVEKDGVAEIKQLWRVGSPDWELINRVKSCSLAR